SIETSRSNPLMRSVIISSIDRCFRAPEEGADVARPVPSAVYGPDPLPRGEPARMSAAAEPLCVRYIGGPTAVLELGGLPALPAPPSDRPGAYPIGSRVLTKTAPPSVAADAIGPIDAVLLSHDHHPDNLDRLGRALLPRMPLVLSTTSAHGRL